MKVLPYSEDVRRYTFQSLNPKVSKDQEHAVEQLIDKMDLMKAALDEEKYEY
jgi:hypothetical protein